MNKVNKFFQHQHSNLSLSSHIGSNSSGPIFISNGLGSELEVHRRNKTKLLGLNLEMNGRMGKSDRSRRVSFNKGKIKKNNLNIYTHSSNYAINTKTGVLMLKLNLLRV